MLKKPMRTAGTLAIGIAVALTGAILSGGAAEAVQADKAKEDKSRRVCRTITPTSSRLTRRVCRTQAEWEQSRDRTQQGHFDQQMKEMTQFAHPGSGP